MNHVPPPASPRGEDSTFHSVVPVASGDVGCVEGGVLRPGRSAGERIAALSRRVAQLERAALEREQLVEELLEQANADFEERTWLRRLFDDLHEFDPATAAAAIKLNLLAPLRVLMAARCVRLLPVGSRHDAPLPHVVVGECPIDAEGCRRFVEDIGNVTKSNRFLFNRHAPTASQHTALVPDGVDSAIALGVELDGELRGWLLAFGKIVAATTLMDLLASSAIGFSETEFGTVEFSLAECAVSSLAARLRLLEASRVPVLV